MTPPLHIEPAPRLYALPLPPSLARPPRRLDPPVLQKPRPTPPTGRVVRALAVVLLTAASVQAQPTATASGTAALPTETTKLTQPGSTYWGQAVSAYGERLLVGSPNDASAGPEAGAVTVHRYDGSAWAVEDTLRASDGQAADRFGDSVAAYGDLAVVGAYNEDSEAEDAGAVYVYRYRAGTAGGWVEEQKLTASDADVNDRFGYAVSVFDDVIVVGTFKASAAYVFRYDGVSWAETQVLSGDGQFGRSVSVWSDRIAVGAPNATAGAVIAAGAVHVYREAAGTFVEQIEVSAKVPILGGFFGTSVSLQSFDRLAVGEPGATVDMLADAGAVHTYVFDDGMGAWQSEADLVAPVPQEGASFGTSLSMWFLSLVVGAPFEDGAAGADAGAAYRFTNSSGWDDGEALTPSDPEAGDRFGETLALSGAAFVGLAWDDDGGVDAGAVYVYGDPIFDPPRPVEQETVHDGAGWRLLSAPVGDLTVTDLAAVNLVQGIPAGAPSATYPAQYPGAGANLFTTYLGTGLASGYAAPAATDAVLVPGRGFWWYWYDEDISPPSGGTSQSYELSSFALSVTGNGYLSDVAETFPESADGFYMIGNPFTSPLRLDVYNPARPEDDAITTSVGTLSSSFYVYDPSVAGYVIRTAVDFTPDVLAEWQGAFAQITGTAGEDPTIIYDEGSQDFGPAPPFYGRRAAEAGLALRLDGVLASGSRVADRAANLRLLNDAEAGWDRHDLSELAPPDADRGQLALVGERDGAPERQGVLSLPLALAGERVVPVAFLASEEGTFEVSWDAAVLPAGWTAALRDRDTGAEADLAAEGTYAFEAKATDWTDRFDILLAASAVAGEAGPEAVTVGDPYPNPTAGGLRLGITVAATQRVTVSVYDALGRRVAVAFDREVGAGAQTLDLDAAALAPGVYVVRVTGDGVAASRRFVVAR